MTDSAAAVPIAEPLGISAILEKVKAHNSGTNLGLIRRAYDFAVKAHADQKRMSGESVLVHLLAVADLLADFHMDETTISAGLLHDVLEDTAVTAKEMREAFGGEITDLVEGVTHISTLRAVSREERQMENLRRMFLAMAKDIRVVLIKLSDRLHNMRTLSYLPEDKIMRISLETMDVYAPLAHRLGIYRVKSELEDLCLRYLHPDIYRDLKEKVSQKAAERNRRVEKAIALLQEQLDQAGIKAQVQGRPKHFYSIYQKMQKGKAFEEIFDLNAVRVITEDVKDCYAVLGCVHNLWKPVPGRFKDYIAMPKSNLYQSLHTTVVSPEGEPLEIQIRTKEMHATAEFGVAAHWRYKDGRAGPTDLDAKFIWLRELLESHQDAKPPAELVENLKKDLFTDEVFVFTPKGEVVQLPRGSSPIDFAYAIHSNVGNHCGGARVNGKMTPLKTALKNGDIVEIVITKTHEPSQQWLRWVKTSKAKNHIRRLLKQKASLENQAKGKRLVEEEISRQHLDAQAVLRQEEDWLKAARAFNLAAVEELWEEIGYGNFSPKMALAKVMPGLYQQQEEEEKRETPKPKKSKDGIIVAGLGDVMLRIAKCCNPLPGEKIVGYLSHNRGLSIHLVECPNILSLDHENDKLVTAEWESDRESGKAGVYSAEIVCKARDRANLLADILQAISGQGVAIESASAGATGLGLASARITVRVEHIHELARVLKAVSGVKDVLEVKRAGPLS